MKLPSLKHWPFAISLLLFSCKNNSPAPPPPAPAPPVDELPAGFSEFYQRFHSDSAFQMEHIVFPLEGLPDDADSLALASNNFRWQQNDWVLQKPVDFQMSEYTRQIVTINPEMVVERIVHKSGEMGMVRRFAIMAGDWRLIYYAGMNRLAR